MVRRAQAGDAAAFTELVRRHIAAVHRVAYVITRSATDADDAVQDGLLRAFRSLGRFDPSRPIRPWLVTIVANRARTRLRSTRRAEGLAARLVPEADGTMPDTAEQAIRDDRRRRVLEHLDRLPERLRRAVALRHILGLSEEETAAALGIPRGTVKSRVSRGLDRMRASMEDEDV